MLEQEKWRKPHLATIFRHGFPAEDGTEPDLERWESFEKPEILGKRVHVGGREDGAPGNHYVNIGRFVWLEKPGVWRSRRSKRNQGVRRTSILPGVGSHDSISFPTWAG